ncbi:sugar transferase [Pseudoalteromonas sp. PS5]|uniref:sugar transferase n=1 Tax=Pseudoalteromonas sp. PS5 TaxID=1437473 RepID=UPI000FFEBF92|nr:sugar transferase [Pseudoalteromonas sp. PS5]RXF03498.1 sugar transferase [Pseudoalteromonas sp. PS5]
MTTIKKLSTNMAFTQTATAPDSTSVRDGRHHGIPVMLQRAIAGLGMLFISPLLILVMLLIKLESQGPCVYKQVRVGKLGRRFTMYKFRSMYMADDPKFKAPDPSQSNRDGVCAKFHNDPRITRVGRFIRKYSIDELPQLFNVVCGDMLLIGPRPALENEVSAYQVNELARLNCEQGLTGLWQVTGRADTTFEQQVMLDTQYIDNQSTVQDIKIICRTIPCVLGARGAY